MTPWTLTEEVEDEGTGRAPPNEPGARADMPVGITKRTAKAANAISGTDPFSINSCAAHIQGGNNRVVAMQGHEMNEATPVTLGFSRLVSSSLRKSQVTFVVPSSGL
jgi:hypothetical protein